MRPMLEADDLFCTGTLFCYRSWIRDQNSRFQGDAPVLRRHLAAGHRLAPAPRANGGPGALPRSCTVTTFLRLSLGPFVSSCQVSYAWCPVIGRFCYLTSVLVDAPPATAQLRVLGRVASCIVSSLDPR